MSETKLCPYRKKLKADLTTISKDLKVDAIHIWDEEFGLCLEDKCAMWRSVWNGVWNKEKGEWGDERTGHCGLAGKP